MANVFVTFDSNVDYIPKLLSKLIDSPTKQWCYKLNRCITDLQNKNIKFYYNTPISMTDDTFDENSELINMANDKKFTNFIYLDESLKNDTYRRIKHNFQKLQNPVITVTRNSITNYGYYNITNSLNYPNKLINLFLAKIINYHIDSGGYLLDPNSWLNDDNYNDDNVEKNKAKNRFIQYNLNDSMERYIGSVKMTDDCHVCSI